MSKIRTADFASFTSTVISILLLGLFATACSVEPSAETRDPEQVRQAINQTYQRVKQAILDQDAEAVADMYTEDVVLHRADGSVVRGKGALREVLTRLVNSGLVLDCEAQDVSLEGNVAIEVGVCSSQRAGVTLDQVKYLMLWRQENGEWKAFNDFVQGAPAREPAEAESVQAVVEEFLAAISGDRTVEIADLLLAGGRFVVSREASGEIVIQTTPFPEFLEQLRATQERYLERIWQPEIEIRRGSATLRAPYDFYRDGQFSHCGVDWFHLVQVDGDWKISSVQYTVETTDCPPSPLGAPDFSAESR